MGATRPPFEARDSMRRLMLVLVLAAAALALAALTGSCRGSCPKVRVGRGRGGCVVGGCAGRAREGDVRVGGGGSRCAQPPQWTWCKSKWRIEWRICITGTCIEVEW